MNVLVLGGAAALGVAIVAGLEAQWSIVALILLALVFGVMFVLPIGGADMPVVISLLNAFTGLAASATGFVLDSTVLIVAGMLVGASGTLLTLLMAKAMNRSIANVLFGAFGQVQAGVGQARADDGRTVRATSPEDVAVQLSFARKVVVVPGYGMAVAQAQHDVRQLADLLEEKGVDVKYAIHPVAGRMPGHMNVLLAEANVPYTQLHEMDEINPEFPQTDVALVIGANDVTNPAARSDQSSPIYGMPILDVDKAASIIVMKRSMNPGFAGHRQRALPRLEDDHALRRREGVGAQADHGRQGRLGFIPWFRSSVPVDVERAVSPHEAYDVVRGAFEAHARAEWSMPSKVYVSNYPAGDFRAMPAIGDGHALLKWVTSFPGNSGSRPTDGHRARPPLRRGGRAAPRRSRRRRGDGASYRRRGRARSGHALPRGGVVLRRVGCGVNGAETARMLVAHGVDAARLGRRRGKAANSSPSGSAPASPRALPRRSPARWSSPSRQAPTCSTRRARSRPASTYRSSEPTVPGRRRSRSQSSAARTSSATTGSRRATAASSPPRSRRVP